MIETIEDLHTELIKLLEEDFASLENYLNAEQSKSYLRFVKRNSKFPAIEFNVGSYRCLIIAEVNVYSRFVFYKTYRININKEDYPKEKLEYIRELDLLTWISRLREFRYEKNLAYPYKMGQRNIVARKNFEAPDFGKIFVQQLEFELNNKHL